MTKFTKLMSLTLVLALTFAMTACGSKEQKPAEESAAAEETQEAEQTQEAETEEAAVEESEYDIAANLTDTVNEDGTRTIETDHFTLTLPLGDTWEYEVNDAASISFYNSAAKNNNFGGHLFTLVAVDPADTDYQNLPHYAEVGEMDGFLYIAEYPSDVQADIANDQNRADYEAVYAELAKIEAQAEDMPLTLK